MTPLLFKFLTQYLAWVDDGADPEAFNPQHGLCDNLRYWCNDLHDMQAITLYQHYDTEKRFRKLLDVLVKAESLDEDYPFGGYDVYMFESETRTHHFNAQRIEWVRHMLDTAPEDVK